MGRRRAEWAKQGRFPAGAGLAPGEAEGVAQRRQCGRIHERQQEVFARVDRRGLREEQWAAVAEAVERGAQGTDMLRDHFGRAQLDKQCQPNPDPVSYTHLTLPTIYSV